MTDVIDLKKERSKRDVPDPKLIYVDEKGVKWYTFSASYQDNDKEFTITFWALDQTDAERRIDLMKQGLKYDGQIYHVEEA